MAAPLLASAYLYGPGWSASLSLPAEDVTPAIAQAWANLAEALAGLPQDPASAEVVAPAPAPLVEF